MNWQGSYFVTTAFTWWIREDPRSTLLKLLSIVTHRSYLEHDIFHINCLIQISWIREGSVCSSPNDVKLDNTNITKYNRREAFLRRESFSWGRLANLWRIRLPLNCLRNIKTVHANIFHSPNNDESRIATFISFGIWCLFK